MKTLLLTLALALTASMAPAAQGGDDGTTLRDFPEVKGTILKSVPYTDKGARHVVILTQEDYPSRPNRDDPDFICGNADVRAYGYNLEGTSGPVWRMHDFVHDCEASATAEFSTDSPFVTDVDGNGLSEVWLVYYVSCKGDVSPDGMKILMYEGGKKHALRGETFMHVDGQDMGGQYTADPAMRAAPQAIRHYADQLWQQHKRR